jgi:hypothetical protein
MLDEEAAVDPMSVLLDERESPPVVERRTTNWPLFDRYYFLPDGTLDEILTYGRLMD